MPEKSGLRLTGVIGSGDHGIRMRRFLLPTLVSLLLLNGSAVAVTGSGTEDIPVDSWVYDALLELSTHGVLPNMLLHTRPLARGEVANAIREYRASQTTPSAGVASVLARLTDEFREELVPAAKIEHRVRLGGGPTARVDQFRHMLARNRMGFDAIGSFTVSDAAATRVRVRFDSDGRHDSQFHGKYWRKNFTAWVEQAVTVVRWKRFTGAFGREYWRWGFSPHDAMLISDQSPPFDGLRLVYRTRNWSYAFHATVLDRMYVFRQDYPSGAGPEGLADRYLVAHRFNWRPRQNLEIAASEVMVFGGFDRPWQWNYMNPVLPYYWEQLNNDTNDNPLWDFELSWRISDGFQVYGEWMIDDFQIDFESEPQQIGVLAGLIWIPPAFDGRVTLNAEYQRINTFVYGQGQPWNRYVHYRDLEGELIGIGSNLGTDADRITVLPLYHLSRHVDLTGRLDYVRRGENHISDPQESGVPKGVPFPSGVVERVLRVGAGTRVNYRGRIVADATVGYYQVENVAHIMGDDLDGLFFRFKLNLLWWETFGV
jgi:hypothetical protein